MSDLVKVDSRSIGKAMLEAGHEAFWIQFRTDNCSLDDFGQALNMANDPDGICGEGGFRTPSGIVFLLVDLGGNGAFEKWIATLVSTSESFGATGILEGAKAAGFPGAWSTEDPTPAAFVAWTQDLEAVAADEHRRGHWHVPADATEKIIEFSSAWTASGGERSVVSLGTFPLAVTSEADLASLVRLSLTHNQATAEPDPVLWTVFMSITPPPPAARRCRPLGVSGVRVVG